MLKGKKVYLRLIEQKDINILYEIYDDKKVTEYESDNFEIPDKQFILKNFPKIRKSYTRGLSIVNEKDVVVGCINYDLIDNNKKIYSIGITIGRRFWGRGYGSDALLTLAEYLFESEKANSIKLEVLVDNKRAIRCYKKVGFVEEKIKRKSYTMNGKETDSIIMVLEEVKLNSEVG